MFESCVAQARSFQTDFNERLLGKLMSNLSYISYKTGNHGEFTRLIEEALTFFQNYESLYVGALVTKAYGLLAFKDYSGCEEVLKQGKDLSKGNEGFTIEFEAIGHLMSLKDKDSINYLENIAIPYCTSQGGEHIPTALGICDTLESYYRKRGAINKANAIAAISRDIYKDMIMGPRE